jgi:hypothetical protein
VRLQRLFFGSRVLRDRDLVGQVTAEEGAEEARQRPTLLLDMVPPAK